MEDSEREKLALDALIKEIGRLQQTVKEWFYPQEKFFAFGMAVVVAGLTLGFTSGPSPVLTLVPIVLFVFFGYMLQVNIEMLSRAGHLRCLEETANEKLGRQVFVDEVYVGPSRQGKRLGRVSFLLFQLFLTVGLLWTIVLGLVASSRFPWWLTLLYSIIVLVGLAMLLASIVEVSSAYRKGYRAALRATPFSSSAAPAPYSPLI